MTISLITATPDENNPSTIAAQIDLFISEIKTVIPQMNTDIAGANTNATTATTQAGIAAAKAADASASATAAASAVNVSAWVSGNTYTAGQCVYSTVDFQSYRHITATSSLTTDPSLDVTNWVLISAPPLSKLHAIALYF